MDIKIALAGNPNCGKTTLFNALTGSNQFVGNWPGVTVEKKEGRLKNHPDVIITDLPGVYSLSPYTLEEVVARNYLLGEHPDAILNIIDGTNLERNLYLTTQLVELGIPVVAAVNMMDIVDRNGDRINTKQLEKELGCQVCEISALKGTGIFEAARLAADAARKAEHMIPRHAFSGTVEHALAHIEEVVLHNIPEEGQRFYAVKLFERDEKIIKQLDIADDILEHIEKDIEAAETELDDDAESIITNERYVYIASVIRECYRKKNKGGLTVSDKIDRVVTNRILALPIFAVVMFIVYFVSVTTVGAWATDWANDGLFGKGFHLFGAGSQAYEEAVQEFDYNTVIAEAFEEKAEGAQSPEDIMATAYFYDDEGKVQSSEAVSYYMYRSAKSEISDGEPDEADFGVWVPGVPILVQRGLDRIGCAEWLQGLIIDGIVGGVGAVLGFVPQMFVLFIFLAFLEACGYMSRIAFVMDRIFRKFGLSGKSFIPMLIGTGCGVPGIMASRTIENERDRRMTIMTTTFIPCGAKLPVIALVAGALFGGAWWVAPSAYFIGITAIVTSGIMLKKTKIFKGDPAPFVMELPAYHMPTFKNVMRSMWERGFSFIKKAGTIILLSAVILWFLQSFGIQSGSLTMVQELDDSLLAKMGSAIAWIFAPLGWGTWEAAVAALTGFIAKENVVGTFGVLYGGFDEVADNGWQIWANLQAAFTPLAAYSFLIFNLLCAPCFAAMGAIKREMNNTKWTLFAIGYQCAFAYAVSLIIYQFGMLFNGQPDIIGLTGACIVTVFLIFMLVRPGKDSQILSRDKKISA